MFKKLVFLFVLIFSLYKLKYEVIAIEDTGKFVEQEIDALRHDYAVLSSEWKFLTNPSRIQFLSERYLKLQNTDPYQLARLEDYINRKSNTFVVSKKNDKF